jgi:hypothetical protein
MTTNVTMVNLLTGFIKNKLSEKQVLRKGFLESFICEENFTSRMIPTYIVDSIYEDDCMDCLKLINFKKIIEYNIIHNPKEVENFLYIFIKNIINELSYNTNHKKYDSYIELVDLLINGGILPEKIICDIIKRIEAYYERFDYDRIFFYINKDIYIVFKNYIDINKIQQKLCLLDKVILNKDISFVRILVEDGVQIYNEQSIINQPYNTIMKCKSYYNNFFKSIFDILFPTEEEKHQQILNYELVNYVDEDNIEQALNLLNRNKFIKDLAGDSNIPIIGFSKSIKMIKILLPYFSLEDKYGRLLNNIDDFNLIKYLLYQGFSPYNGISKINDVYSHTTKFGSQEDKERLKKKVLDINNLHKKYKEDLKEWLSSSKNNNLCKYVWGHIISFL